MYILLLSSVLTDKNARDPVQKIPTILNDSRGKSRITGIEKKKKKCLSNYA